MKRIDFEIYPFNEAIYFPHSRVKTKLQVVTILLEAIRYMLSYSHSLGEGVERTGSMTIVVDKMSRLIFSSKNKCFSIVLPFYVHTDGDKILFHYKSEEIDSRLLSHLITILNSDTLNSRNSLDFSDSLIDFEYEYEMIWELLKELLLYEDGYVRYDIDEESYLLAKQKGTEHTHPLNHCDLFYSGKASLKLGLDKAIDLDEFIDILNTKTDCKYLRNWR